MLDCLFQNFQMVCGRKMYDTNDGCACQYRCSKVFYILSVIVAGRRILIDQAIDSPGYGKGVVDGLNATGKGYIGKCLCLTGITEVYNNKKNEYSFYE